MNENENEIIVKTGTEAPDFCLPTSDDVELCLRDIKGNWIVLYFYPKDNTPGCTTEAMDVLRNFAKFIELGVTVIGISPDSTVRHRRFIGQRGLKQILLSDENHDIGKLYGIFGIKRLFGKDVMTRVRTTFLISPDGKIAQQWRHVKVAKHIQIVIEEIEKQQIEWKAKEELEKQLIIEPVSQKTTRTKKAKKV